MKKGMSFKGLRNMRTWTITVDGTKALFDSNGKGYEQAPDGQITKMK